MSDTSPKGWFARLKAGLSKSSGNLSRGIGEIFTKCTLDQAALDALEELLIEADMGAATASRLVQNFSTNRFDKEIDEREVKQALAQEIAALLTPVAKKLAIDGSHVPYVILVVGVNGNGKTTTIGKLAMQFKQQGYTVIMAAADTFRAAAVEQLKVWGERVGCEVVTGAENADPASVAFQAVEQAKAAGADVLLIDTAGRLHNKNNLMQELQKIIKVIKKLDETAPHAVLQVLDATTGQNAIAQVQAFKEMVQVTGLVITKLDGTAKGGIVVALADRFTLPIYAVGVGEAIDDLREFDAGEFAKGLLGLSNP